MQQQQPQQQCNNNNKQPQHDDKNNDATTTTTTTPRTTTTTTKLQIQQQQIQTPETTINETTTMTRQQQQRCNNNNHNNNKILSCSLSNDVFHLQTDMVKWPKKEATRGNQYPEPNFTNYANFVLCRTKKKLNFLSNFTKIRTNFKRENKKYFLCRNPGM